MNPKPGDIKGSYARPGELFRIMAIVTADPEPLILAEETGTYSREWFLLSEWDDLDANY